MGLDISVMKPKKVENINEEDDYFYNIEENKELEIFNEFAIEKTNTYYDLEKGLKNLGFDNLEDLESDGMMFSSKKSVFYYRDKTHELYEAFQYVNDVWSKCYFGTRKELFDSEEYKKFLEYLPLLKKYGYRPLYKFYASGSKLTYYNLNSAHKFLKRKIAVDLVNPPTFDRVDRCIACDEIGYQRKGANTKFYQDGMWDSQCVIDSKILNEHWEKYFSKQTPESPGGWGSGVEFVLEDDEMKNRFKENIVDKFVEGETFVIYH